MAAPEHAGISFAKSLGRLDFPAGRGFLARGAATVLPPYDRGEDIVMSGS